MEEEKKEKNEFEDLEEDFPTQDDVSDVPGSADQDMIASGSSGVEYNFDEAPDTVKAPPRQDMDGKETIITDAKLILPDTESDWVRSRSGKVEYKYCIFKLFYEGGQQEFYSGVRVFKRMQNGKAKYSDPSITRDRVNQASNLLGLYADYKEKDINEVSLKEFLSYLKTKPKIQIKGVEVTNPTSGEKIKKNLVGKFL